MINYNNEKENIGLKLGTKYENQAYENQAYENQAYENQAYENQAYENQAYENQAYENQAYENQAYINKINKLLSIVYNTYNSIQRYKLLFLHDTRDVFNSTLVLQNISVNLKNILYLLENNTNIDTNSFTLALKEITRDLQLNIKTYGTDKIEDILYLSFDEIPILNTEQYNLLNVYAHPISYNILEQEKSTNQIIVMDIDNEPALDNEYKSNEYKSNEYKSNEYKYFNTKIHCIQLTIHYNTTKLIINCLVEDICLDILHENYITKKLSNLSYNDNLEDENKIIQWYDYLHTNMFGIYVSCLTMKDLILYNETDIHKKYIEYMNNITTIKQTNIDILINDFIKLDLYHKRKQLLYLLINTEDQEFQFIAYLLYDLLSNDISGVIDTTEQTLLFDSLPFKMKQLFHTAMKETINYTKKLSNVDVNSIPLEQRICLLKTSDNVKEKAVLKLKEIKAKNEDSGSKARHYLDGLLKIPFAVLKEEPILKVNKECIQLFNELIKQIKQIKHLIPYKDSYNSIEIQTYSHLLKTQVIDDLYKDLNILIKNTINISNRKTLVSIIVSINKLIKTQQFNYEKIKYVNKKLTDLREDILNALNNNNNNLNLFNFLLESGEEDISLIKTKINTINLISNNIQAIDKKYIERSKYLNNITETLDKAVYGHATAKRQLERIIGQWVNGENKGYCFGFEGPPGVGKTSLAKKGIADCLKDAQGISRPFAFIAIGGSANGSTLEGHNYTYVGSTWGKIVDILMETKCMNPIIFIDELDKVSKTEHGKEIISILTHLVDPTQNESFQDKYFNGVDIDVSNILFVFSYNDANLIDKILLDRIHIIKFDNLSLNDKIVISKQFILPDIYTKMGLLDSIIIDSEEIEYIIEEYTAESGVRKLKEIIFDIVGEINLTFLKNSSCYDNTTTFPLKITKEDIRDKYLKECDTVNPARIHLKDAVGIINGLWANSLGKGGVLPIEANYFPSSTFLDLKLTGMQGDVMKESMNVAKTLAWSLLSEDSKKLLHEDKQKGLHIHVPEGATPKDGPSAGTAITVVMYSLFLQKKIKHDVAITGEICLSGRVTAIGGLELKILGGIKAGVKMFLFPKDNMKDFLKIKAKYGEKLLFKDITFIAVEHIDEVLVEVFI
jgi:endopeptidase La